MLQALAMTAGALVVLQFVRPHLPAKVNKLIWGA